MLIGLHRSAFHVEDYLNDIVFKSLTLHTGMYVLTKYLHLNNSPKFVFQSFSSWTKNL